MKTKLIIFILVTCFFNSISSAEETIYLDKINKNEVTIVYIRNLDKIITATPFKAKNSIILAIFYTTVNKRIMFQTLVISLAKCAKYEFRPYIVPMAEPYED